jgi:hypothetical protein
MTGGAERAHRARRLGAGVVAELNPDNHPASHGTREDRLSHGRWIDGVLGVEDELSK